MNSTITAPGGGGRRSPQRRAGDAERVEPKVTHRSSTRAERQGRSGPRPLPPSHLRDPSPAGGIGRRTSSAYSSSATGRRGGSTSTGRSAPARYQRSTAARRARGVAPDGELVEECLRGCRNVRGAPCRVRREHRVDGRAETAAAQCRGIHRSHAHQVGRHPPRRERPRGVGILRDRDRQPGADQRHRAAGACGAFPQQRDPLREPRSRDQEGIPPVGEFAGQLHGPGPERGEVHGNLPRRLDGQPHRPVGGPFTGEQRSDLAGDRPELGDRVGERSAVQAGELRRSRSEAEDEPASGHRVQGGRQHRDRGRAASPDVEHSGTETDPAGPPGDRGKQHGGVVAPPLRQQEGVVAEGLRPFGEVHHDVVPGLHGGDTDGQGRAAGWWVSTSGPPFLPAATVDRAHCSPIAGTPIAGTTTGRAARTGALPDPRPAAGRGSWTEPVAVGGPKPRAAARGPARGGGQGRVRRPAGRRPLAGRGAPGAPSTALRAYVSRLRGVLAPAVALRHRPPGYCLILDDGDLDAAEFERLVGAGAGRRRRGRPRSRARPPRRRARACGGATPLAEFADDDFAARHGRPAGRAARRRARGAGADAARAGPGRRGAAASSRRWSPPPVPGATRGRADAGALRDAAGRPTRWPPTTTCAAGSTTSWASSPPTPAQALYRRILVHDPALADGARGRATCRGGRAVSSAAARRSSVSVPRCGPRRW